jgi:hypothetical protein
VSGGASWLHDAGQIGKHVDPYRRRPGVEASVMQTGLDPVVSFFSSGGLF